MREITITLQDTFRIAVAVAIGMIIGRVLGYGAEELIDEIRFAEIRANCRAIRVPQDAQWNGPIAVPQPEVQE